MPAYRPPELPTPPTTNGRVTIEEARFIVAHAVLAPSGGNCQPWRFEFRADELRGFIVPERTQQFLDFRHRAAYVALGAAAENIDLAARSIGLAAHIEACPDSSDPALAFRVRLARSKEGAVDGLAAQIPLRVTNRKTGPRLALTATERAALGEAAAVHGGTLRLIENRAALDALGTLLGRCVSMPRPLPRRAMDWTSILWSCR
jgi:nitroreductase